jgi:hypothetical protein
MAVSSGHEVVASETDLVVAVCQSSWEEDPIAVFLGSVEEGGELAGIQVQLGRAHCSGRDAPAANLTRVARYRPANVLALASWQYYCCHSDWPRKRRWYKL